MFLVFKLWAVATYYISHMHTEVKCTRSSHVCIMQTHTITTHSHFSCNSHPVCCLTNCYHQQSIFHLFNLVRSLVIDLYTDCFLCHSCEMYLLILGLVCMSSCMWIVFTTSIFVHVSSMCTPSSHTLNVLYLIVSLRIVDQQT